MDFRSWCKTYFPGGTFSTSKDGENYGLVKNPYRDDSRPSLSFGTKGKGVYNDFGGRGGDIKFFVHEHGIPEVWDGAEPWEERREGGKILSYRGEDHANARQAWQMWEEGKPADDHPYLQKKGYSGEDLRVTSREYRFEKDVVTPAGTLLIPATDLYGAFQGVERIFPDLSRDKAHRGGKSRCYYGDKPEDGKPLYLVEGWATREAVKRITGGNTAVSEVFGLACMAGFAKAVKELHPTIELVFCPDKPGSGEQRKIIESLKQYGTVVELPEDREKNFDWDDELRRQGIEPTKSLFRDRWALAQTEAVEAPREDEEVNILDLVESPSPGTAQKPEKVWHFPRKHLNLVAADPGMGKSILMTKVASDLSIGVPVLGMIAEPVRKTLYLNGECGKDYFNWRFKASGWEYSAENFCVVHQEVLADNGVDLDLDTPQGRKNLESLLDAKKPDLLIIDSLPAFSDEDLNDGKAQNAICKHLKTLASKYNLAVVLITHLRKRRSQDQGAEPTLSEIQGSNAGAKLCNVALVIYESPVEIEGEERVIKVCKSVKAWGPKVLPFGFSFPELGEDELILHLEELPERHNQPQGSWDRVRNALQYTEFTRQAVENLLGISDRTAKNLLAEWQQKGKIERFGHGKNTAYQVTKDYAGTRVSISSPNQEKPVIASNDTGTSLFTESGPQEEKHSVKNSFTESNPVISIDDEDSVKYIDSASPKMEMSVSHSVKGNSKEYSPFHGALSIPSIAARAGVSVEAIRESLSEWETCGRVSLDGDKIIIFEGDAYPGQDETEPPEETSVTAPKDLPSSSPGQVRLFEDEPVRGEGPSSCGKVVYSPEMARVWLESQPEEVKAEYQAKLKRLKGVEMPDYENVALLRTWEQFGKTS